MERQIYSKNYHATHLENYKIYTERRKSRRKLNTERFKSYDIAAMARRKARKLQASGSFTSKQWRDLKAQYDYTCLCCGKREPDIKLSADHVIPLAKGGSNDIENIQPLCISCNSTKYLDSTDYRKQATLDAILEGKTL